MSTQEMVQVGFIVDAANNGAFVSLKKIKTSLTNIRSIVKLEKAVNIEMKTYQESVNEYIMQNGEGEGDNRKIDTSNPAVRNDYIRHIMEVRDTASDIAKLSKPIFTLEELDEKGIELTAEEAVIYGEFGVIEFSLDEDEEETPNLPEEEASEVVAPAVDKAEADAARAKLTKVVDTE